MKFTARDYAKITLFVWMLGVIWAAFFYVQPAAGFKGESSRIVLFHVPCAWVATLAFMMSCVCSVMYLRRRQPIDDIRAAAAARLGLVYAFLSTVTGAVFAKIMWGAYWNWDPRQTSITFLLLIYAAYLALRSAVEDPERRASLAAVYAILAFVTVPFLMFVVPRIYWSLHPDSIINFEGKNQLDSRYTLVLILSSLGFIGFYFWKYAIECRLEAVRQKRQQEVL